MRYTNAMPHDPIDVTGFSNPVSSMASRIISPSTLAVTLQHNSSTVVATDFELFTHFDRSSTIHVAPRPSNCVRSWLVQTAKTRQPAATPALIPDGASSTTMPNASSIPQGNSRFGNLTFLRIHVECFGADHVGLRIRFTVDDIGRCDQPWRVLDPRSR